MPLINPETREINVKIVYYGPSGAGKRTTLEQIYRKLKPEMRGKLKTMPAGSDRLFLFDFLPGSKSELDGHTLRIHLYTLHGAAQAKGTWKSVLKGADGVVFTADCDPGREQENVASLEALEGLLEAVGSSVADLPVVFQYNRRDLAPGGEVSQLQQKLNRFNFPAFPTSSATAEGIMSPLSSLVKMITSRITLAEPVPVGKPQAEPAAPPVEPPTLSPPVPEVTVGTPVAAGGVVAIPLTVKTPEGETTVTIHVSVTTDAA
ncbi:MAG TPA: gliding-motility protein MglA [Verrucomicrobiae bacterium]|nr:gliding-motility protein MglA [Verrucomicrobiae bacterium]